MNHSTRSDDPSPLRAAVARAVIVAVPSPLDAELSVSCGDSGLPIPFGHSFRMWKERATITWPIPPLRTSSTASATSSLDRR